MTDKIRTRSKSELKRDSILKAAVRCFSENGFVHTSMDSIAKLAGVSKQTVYSHFGNKDDLFMASVGKKCEEFKQAAFASSKQTDIKGTLTNFAVEFIRLMLSDEGMSAHRLCVAEAQVNPKVSQLFYQAGPELVIKSLAELLDDINKQVSQCGGVGKAIDDTYRAAIQFLCLVKGEAVMRREYNTTWQPSTKQIKAYIDSSVGLFLRGYGIAS
ncbi:TetR/AcrR family transcriptional regulator [Thalassotalea ponticola]|uniref:TetR/AcrR family transcriptional regulator n=1 Tax=Thalassotalea ponticola TaxID=1523392 RepID=UPI0025B600C8|nr:TetR/AcrR family transcriptional regulator [Thalassotalea ponticola]MDN3653230.1 TetR/AcrR family transcriptional regulator [Thalassotalea ponticola]